MLNNFQIYSIAFTWWRYTLHISGKFYLQGIGLTQDYFLFCTFEVWPKFWQYLFKVFLKLSHLKEGRSSTHSFGTKTRLQQYFPEAGLSFLWFACACSTHGYFPWNLREKSPALSTSCPKLLCCATGTRCLWVWCGLTGWVWTGRGRAALKVTNWILISPRNIDTK